MKEEIIHEYIPIEHMERYNALVREKEKLEKKCRKLERLLKKINKYLNNNVDQYQLNEYGFWTIRDIIQIIEKGL